MSLHQLLQDEERLLALEPEELAGFLLEDYNQQATFGRVSPHAGNLANSLHGRNEEVVSAVMEAFAWLVSEGLLVPGNNTGFYTISRRGKLLKGHADVAAYSRERWLPRAFLHPVIAQKCWSAFIRGEYDTAVFQAYKEVEVAVRSAGKYKPTDLGPALMRKAFAPKDGPLADQQSPEAEREALSSIFAGAIGCYKNPSSHRHVSMDSRTGVELLVFASHLLRLVDERKGN